MKLFSESRNDLRRGPARKFSVTLRGGVVVTVMGVLALFLVSGGSRAISARVQGAGSTQPLRTVVCTVSGEGAAEMSMDAVVVVENGKLQAPYKDEEEADQQRFGAAYFRAGRKFRLLFGGGEVGSATVTKFAKGCNNIHATATVETSAKINGQVRGLATNSETLGRKPSSRRAPTEVERAAVMLQVKQIYQAKGTTPALLRRLQTINLTATDLDGDGKFELIGSFVIEIKPDRRRDLFLIAEPEGKGYKATLSEYQSYKLHDGFDSAVKFVDQLDLDGDGVAEVFVIQGGYDAYGYGIYKKQAGRWRQVYTFTGDAC